jgi:3-oxoacyl-[acyl-carrier-protein] synthase II
MKKAPGDRIAITGVGLASPLGTDAETSWQALLNGEHGVKNVTESLFSNYASLPIHVAAPVPNFNLLDDPSFNEHKKAAVHKWDLSQQFVLWSGAQALRQANLLEPNALQVDKVDPERFGIYIGTGVGGAVTLAEVGHLLEVEKARYLQALEEDDQTTIDDITEQTAIKPRTILKALPGRAAATPSMIFGAKAFWKGLLQECASGNGAIISAIEAIKLGKADVVLAGGVEGAITPSTLGLFGAAGAVSRNRNPDEASRPLDQGRDGLVMGQGAGVLVVEDYDHAVDRGAPILAEVVGWHENADAMFETEPDPKSVARCIYKAIEMVGSVEKLKGFSANEHATSTVLGDPAEMTALSTVLRPDQIVGISAPKSATGHMLGAAGAAEAVFSVLGVRDGKTPPIRNLEDPIEEARGYEHLMSADNPIEDDIEYVVNSSFGFGGNNAVTIFSKPR